MQVQRSRKKHRVPKRRGQVSIHSVRRPAGQMRRLRLWVALAALLAAAAVAAAGFCFWVQFAAPFRQAAERDAAGASSSPSKALPVYDDSFNLVLVNSENRLPEDFEVRLATVDGVEVEERIAVYLELLLADAAADGIDLRVDSGYVSVEEQTARYESAVQSLMEGGLSRMKAEDEAARTVGAGGYSEFQTGMAVIFATGESGSFASTAAYRWLVSNCIQYGFILRYPENKTAYTQMEFSPAHFRFVGVKHATRMRELELCLEEYTRYLSSQG